MDKTLPPNLSVLPFDASADRRYGEVRADVERRGRPSATPISASHPLPWPGAWRSLQATFATFSLFQDSRSKTGWSRKQDLGQNQGQHPSVGSLATEPIARTPSSHQVKRCLNVYADVRPVIAHSHGTDLGAYRRGRRTSGRVAPGGVLGAERHSPDAVHEAVGVDAWPAAAGIHAPERTRSRLGG